MEEREEEGDSGRELPLGLGLRAVRGSVKDAHAWTGLAFFEMSTYLRELVFDVLVNIGCVRISGPFVLSSGDCLYTQSVGQRA